MKGICNKLLIISSLSLGGCFGDISSLSERVESAESRLATLEKRLKNLQDKAAVVAGEESYPQQVADDASISSMFGKPSEQTKPSTK